MKLLIPIAIVVALVIGARFLTIGFPFNTRRVYSEKNEGSFLAVATYGEIETGKGRRFFSELEASLDSLSESEGLVGYAARKQLIGPKVWTISVWENDDALQNFLRSEAHRNASRNGTIVPGSFRSSFFEIEAADVPVSWKRALSELRREFSRSSGAD